MPFTTAVSKDYESKNQTPEPVASAQQALRVLEADVLELCASSQPQMQVQVAKHYSWGASSELQGQNPVFSSILEKKLYNPADF